MREARREPQPRRLVAAPTRAVDHVGDGDREPELPGEIDRGPRRLSRVTPDRRGQRRGGQTTASARFVARVRVSFFGCEADAPKNFRSMYSVIGAAT